MHEHWKQLSALAGVAALAAVLAPPLAAAAQGKIVCWKDSSGKVIGCGDKVPPEFQGSATKELDSRGVTRRTTESVEEANRRRMKEKESAQTKAEDERRTIDQKRQDTALLESYSNEKEIDLKRDRDLQVIDLQIEQLNVSLKNATQRYNEAKGRVDGIEKSGKAAGAPAKESLARAASDKQRFENSIAAKNQEKEELRKRYADQRTRYLELRKNPSAIGIPPMSAASTSATASAKK